MGAPTFMGHDRPRWSSTWAAALPFRAQRCRHPTAQASSTIKRPPSPRPYAPGRSRLVEPRPTPSSLPDCLKRSRPRRRPPPLPMGEEVVTGAFAALLVRGQTRMTSSSRAPRTAVVCGRTIRATRTSRCEMMPVSGRGGRDQTTVDDLSGIWLDAAARWWRRRNGKRMGRVG